MENQKEDFPHGARLHWHGIRKPLPAYRNFPKEKRRLIRLCERGRRKARKQIGSVPVG